MNVRKEIRKQRKFNTSEVREIDKEVAIQLARANIDIDYDVQTYYRLGLVEEKGLGYCGSTCSLGICSSTGNDIPTIQYKIKRREEL